MKRDLMVFDGPVTLVGGGELDAGLIAAAREIAPRVVAADRGADRLDGFGVPEDQVAAVIGDLDSIADRARWEGGATRVLHLEEQETTDFEKCLYSTEAPLYVAVGFTGRRVDHTLAVLHALLSNSAKRVIVLGPDDAVALVPPGGIALDLAVGARVSFFPLAPVNGVASEGLEWPIDGLDFAPGWRIGTSNRATAARVSARFDGPPMLVMVERRFLGTLAAAVGGASQA